MYPPLEAIQIGVYQLGEGVRPNPNANIVSIELSKKTMGRERTNEISLMACLFSSHTRAPAHS